MNDSSTGGYIQPIVTAAYDDALTDFLAAVVVGITGLDGTLVRPRWQPIAPQMPPLTTTWCAVGSGDIDNYGDGFPYQSFDDNDVYSLKRDETIDVLATFYGPQSQSMAQKLRDGVYIAQNREAMEAGGYSLTDVSGIRIAAEKYNNVWVRRYDLALIFARRATSTYPILPVLSAPGTIQTDDGLTTHFNAEG